MCDAGVSAACPCSPRVLCGSRGPARALPRQAVVVPVVLALPGFTHCSGTEEGSPAPARA